MPSKNTKNTKSSAKDPKKSTAKKRASTTKSTANKKRKTPAKKRPVKKTAPRRKKHTKNSKKSITKTLFSWFWKIALVGICLFFIFFITVYLGFWGRIPNDSQLESIKNPLASEVYSQDGKLLGRYYTENRSYISFNEISPNVIHALVATEDSRFYEHDGIDKMALLRVAFKSIIMGDRSSGGGSTLSQQTAKNLFPRKKGSFMMPANKLRESIIANRLEEVYSKDEILTLYLNTVPFGENIFGIGLAAERFFSKKPSQLNVEEAAVLVGMLKANNSYNPRKHPDRSKKRRNTVIDRMVTAQYLSEAEGEQYKAKPLVLRYKVISYNTGPAAYFMAMIRPELLKWCADNIKPDGEPYNLYTDGLKIKTTINFTYQEAAKRAVKEQLRSLQHTFNTHWQSSKPWDKNWAIFNSAMKQSERYRKMKKNNASDDQIKKAFATPREMTILDWDGAKDVKMSPNDSIKHSIMTLHAGFMAMSPTSGQLLAWVGGIDFKHYQYDHVNAARQVGSTFKPFVYLSGLEHGLEADQYFSNERKTYKEYQNWSPKNSHNSYTGYYSMSGALAKSVNTVAVDVLMQAGINNTIDVAQDLGITADLPKYPSLALGVASISLKEMVAAYAGIINDGMYIKPYYLVSIEDAHGKTLATFNAEKPKNTGLNPDNTRAVVQMMKQVVDNGSGRAMRSTWGVSGDLAAKTGTTQNNSDGWFIAASPSVVAGCWVGASNPSVHFRTIRYGQGAYMALPAVGRFYKSIYSNPNYSKLKWQKFKTPSAETMQKLSIAPFVETLPRKQAKEVEKSQYQNADEKLNWFERLKQKREEKKKERERKRNSK